MNTNELRNDIALTNCKKYHVLFTVDISKFTVEGTLPSRWGWKRTFI